MMIMVVVLLLLVCYIVLPKLNTNSVISPPPPSSKQENFDGIGKGFSEYYHPQKCSKSKNCYPGMYLGNSFWKQNM